MKNEIGGLKEMLKKLPEMMGRLETVESELKSTKEGLSDTNMNLLVNAEEFVKCNKKIEKHEKDSKTKNEKIYSEIGKIQKQVKDNHKWINDKVENYMAEQNKNDALMNRKIEHVNLSVEKIPTVKVIENNISHEEIIRKNKRYGRTN